MSAGRKRFSVVIHAGAVFSLLGSAAVAVGPPAAAAVPVARTAAVAAFAPLAAGTSPSDPPSGPEEIPAAYVPWDPQAWLDSTVDQDTRNMVADLAETSPEPEIRAAAQAAMDAGDAAIAAFFPTGYVRALDKVNKRRTAQQKANFDAVAALIGTKGPLFNAAAQRALDGTPEDQADFLAYGGQVAQAMDDAAGQAQKDRIDLLRSRIRLLIEAAGPNVKQAAQQALDGDGAAVQQFFDSGYLAAAKLDQAAREDYLKTQAETEAALRNLSDLAVKSAQASVARQEILTAHGKALKALKEAADAMTSAAAASREAQRTLSSSLSAADRVTVYERNKAGVVLFLSDASGAAGRAQVAAGQASDAAQDLVDLGLPYGSDWKDMSAGMAQAAAAAVDAIRAAGSAVDAIAAEDAALDAAAKAAAKAEEAAKWRALAESHAATAAKLAQLAAVQATAAAKAAQRAHDDRVTAQAAEVVAAQKAAAVKTQRGIAEAARDDAKIQRGIAEQARAAAAGYRAEAESQKGVALNARAAAEGKAGVAADARRHAEAEEGVARQADVDATALAGTSARARDKARQAANDREAAEAAAAAAQAQAAAAKGTPLEGKARTAADRAQGWANTAKSAADGAQSDANTASGAAARARAAASEATRAAARAQAAARRAEYDAAVADQAADEAEALAAETHRQALVAESAAADATQQEVKSAESASAAVKLAEQASKESAESLYDAQRTQDAAVAAANEAVSAAQQANTAVAAAVSARTTAAAIAAPANTAINLVAPFTQTDIDADFTAQVAALALNIGQQQADAAAAAAAAAVTAAQQAAASAASAADEVKPAFDAASAAAQSTQAAAASAKSAIDSARTAAAEAAVARTAAANAARSDSAAQADAKAARAAANEAANDAAIASRNAAAATADAAAARDAAAVATDAAQQAQAAANAAKIDAGKAQAAADSAQRYAEDTAEKVAQSLADAAEAQQYADLAEQREAESKARSVAVNRGELPSAGNPCSPSGVSQAAVGACGDPVDTATGAFYESYTDLGVQGRGPGLAVGRSYNSGSAATDGPFGFGWRLSYDAHLDVAASGDVTVVQENGSTAAFTAKDGGYAPAAHVQATLARSSDGTWTFVRQATQELRFDSRGRLTSVADPNGETTTLRYTGGLLTEVADPAGRSIAFTYSGNRISRITDPKGRTVDYGYDGSGNLTSVKDAEGAYLRFGYDSAHRVVTVTRPTVADPTAVKDRAAGGSVTTNHYDGDGRVSSQTDPLGGVTTFAYAGNPFSATGGATSVTDPAGVNQLDQYRYGLRRKAITGLGSNAELTTLLAYDPATLGVIRTETTQLGDPNSHVVSATYNDRGLATSSTDAAGRLTETSYNALGRPLSVTSPNPSTVGPARVTTWFSYDDNGNLTSRTRRLYSSTTAYTEQKTTYRHEDADHPGDVTSVVDPLTHVTTIRYDDAGNVTSTRTPEGRTTSSTYDPVGRVLTVTAPKGHQANGDLTADAAKHTTTTDYDKVGRVLGTRTPNGDRTVAVTIAYTPGGLVARSTDADRRSTSADYDLNGRRITITRPDGTTQRTTYWPNGRVHTQIDGNGDAVAYALDDLGRVASSTDALNRVTSYSYDASGAPLTVKDAQGQVTTNTYNPVGQVLTTAYSDGTTPKVTRTYNGAGLQATVQDGTGTTTSTYDSLGRLTSRAAPGGTVGYTYTLAGQVDTLTYPGSKQVDRDYGDDGQLAKVTDWAGRSTGFGYDANGAWTSTRTPNGVTTTSGLDDAGRITSTTFTGPGNTALAALGYQRDDAGQILHEPSTGLGANRAFGYDDNGRLASEQPDGGSILKYEYDEADNLTTSAASGTGTVQYDAAHQLTTSSAGGTYAFDARGNRRSSTTGGATTEYGYDQANRLTSYKRGSATASYRYDGDSLRVGKTVNGSAQTFSFDTVSGGLPLILTDGAAAYLYGPGGAPFAQIEADGGKVTYLHQDQLGSIRLLTDEKGVRVGSASYAAYGTRTVGGAGSAFGLAGQYTDAESGLLYLRARIYDPATGGFLTVDPLVSATRSPYGYANADPVNRSDPSGLVTLGLCFGGGAAFFTWSGMLEGCAQLAWDETNGTLETGGTFTYGTGAGSPAIGASGTVSASNARTVGQLGGPFEYAGASGGTFSGGGYWGSSCGAPDDYVVGGQFGRSTPGAEVHGGTSNTLTSSWWSHDYDMPDDYRDFIYRFNRDWDRLSGMFDW